MKTRNEAAGAGCVAALLVLAVLAATPLDAAWNGAPAPKADLEGVSIGQPTCQRIEPGDDSPLARLWRSAEGPLRSVAEAEQEERYEFDVVYWNRAADLASDLVLGEQVSEPVEASRTLDTPPIEVLVQDGWIQLSDDGSGYDYFGLGAAALVSDAFLEAHCFALREEAENDGTVLLAFEPDPPTDLPGVRGILRVDRDTGAPVDLEYRYTRHPDELGIAPDDFPRFHGTVEFRPLPEGGWIAGRWAIHMPWFWQDPDRGEQLGRLERGGEVVRVRTAAGEHVPDRAWAAVEGVVLDSTRMEGLGGADVHLLGTSHLVQADPDGRFRIEVPSEGIYLARFSHPRLDTLGVEDLPDAEATLVRGRTVRLALGGPSIPTLAALECGREVGTGPDGIVMGRVTEPGIGGPMGGVSVRLFEAAAGADAPPAFESVTDPDGHFRFCETPSEVSFRLETELVGITGPVINIRLAEGEARSLDLTLSLALEGEVRGTVREGATGPPIGNATVRLLGVEGDRSTLSDARGRFTIEEIPSGRYELRISHVGYQELVTEVEVGGGGRATNLTARLLRDAIALDPITVEVEARPSWGPLAEVYDRRDYMQGLGIGTFFDRQAIEREAGAQVTRMIARMAGVRLQPSPRMGSQSNLLNIHRTNSCHPAFFVDGMRYRLSGERPPIDPNEEIEESIDDVVSLYQIEMVEVYRSSAQLPMEFATERAALCGAIAVWTRRGH